MCAFMIVVRRQQLEQHIPFNLYRHGYGLASLWRCVQLLNLLIINLENFMHNNDKGEITAINIHCISKRLQRTAWLHFSSSNYSYTSKKSLDDCPTGITIFFQVKKSSRIDYLRNLNIELLISIVQQYLIIPRTLSQWMQIRLPLHNRDKAHYTTNQIQNLKCINLTLWSSCYT